MLRALVVVCRTRVVSPDSYVATGEVHHISCRRSACTSGDHTRCGIRSAELELQRLEDGLVVLVLVLENHVVDETVAKERVVVVPFEYLELLQHACTDFRKSPQHLVERRQRKRCAFRPRMLERVVHPGHLRKLYRPAQVPRQPQLLEVRDVSDIPDDRTHQGIMLPVKIVVRQARDQEQCAVARLTEAVAYQLPGWSCLDGRYRHCRHE